MSQNRNTSQATSNPSLNGTPARQQRTLMFQQKYTNSHVGSTYPGTDEEEKQALLQKPEQQPRYRLRNITNKMAFAKSIKMYLTIFVATTCIYMVLYQYHLSRQPLPAPEIIKSKEVISAAAVGSADANFSVAGDSSYMQQDQQPQSARSPERLRKRYNFFLWSPISLFNAQAHRLQQQKQQQLHLNAQSNSDKQSSATAISAKSTASQLVTNAMVVASSQKSSNDIVEVVTAAPLSAPSSAAAAQTHQSSTSSASFMTLPSSTSSTSSATSFTSSTHTLSTHNQTIKTSDLLKKHLMVAAHRNHSNANADGTGHSVQPEMSSLTSPARSAKPNQAKASSVRGIPVLKDRTASTGTISATATDVATRFQSNNASLPPPLYIITPTYRRPEQLAELTRLGYTLKHVVNMLWIVVEDANRTSPLVTQTLNRIGVPYEYFLAPMPEEYKKTKKAKPRGVSNRNRGLEWLRANATEGVFYFADDDNTYDISIFEQMRYTKKVSMWPVGLVTKFGVSSPIIRNGKIDGFYDGWIGGRKFPVDMAGFAVSVKFLHERPAAKMPFKPGYEEDGFLKSLAPLNLTEIELLATNCTQILTWHTQTKKNTAAEALNMSKYANTNLVSIDKMLVRP